MKRPNVTIWMMVAAVVSFIGIFGAMARAVTVNPAEWDFFLENYDQTYDYWESDTNVPSDDSVYDYDYTWQLNQADLQLDGTSWWNILDFIPDTTGFGSEQELWFDIFSPVYPLHIELDEGRTFHANIYLGVNEDGYGQAALVNIIFGQTVAGENVTGARFGGELNVNAVPEPATLLLLGLGGMVLLRKKRIDKRQDWCIIQLFLLERDGARRIHQSLFERERK